MEMRAELAHGIIIHFDTSATAFSGLKYLHQHSIEVLLNPPSQDFIEILVCTNFTRIQCTLCALFVSVFNLSRNPNLHTLPP